MTHPHLQLQKQWEDEVLIGFFIGLPTITAAVTLEYNPTDKGNDHRSKKLPLVRIINTASDFHLRQGKNGERIWGDRNRLAVSAESTVFDTRRVVLAYCVRSCWRQRGGAGYMPASVSQSVETTTDDPATATYTQLALPDRPE